MAENGSSDDRPPRAVIAGLGGGFDDKDETGTQCSTSSHCVMELPLAPAGQYKAGAAELFGFLSRQALVGSAMSPLPCLFLACHNC